MKTHPELTDLFYSFLSVFSENRLDIWRTLWWTNGTKKNWEIYQKMFSDLFARKKGDLISEWSKNNNFTIRFKLNVEFSSKMNAIMSGSISFDGWSSRSILTWFVFPDILFRTLKVCFQWTFLIAGAAQVWSQWN